jgi:LAO/AO transport system kinase
MVLNILEDKILTMLEDNPSYYNFIDKIQNKKVDPYQAADDLSSGLLNNIINQYPKKSKIIRS